MYDDGGLDNSVNNVYKFDTQGYWLKTDLLIL